MTLDPSKQNQCLQTGITPPGYAQAVQVLASGTNPGVLEAGETVTVSVYYAGWLTLKWSASASAPIPTLGVISADNTTSVPWATLQLQPPSISNAAWVPISANLTRSLGTTWGGIVQKFDADCSYLASLGEKVTDADQLWTFEIQQANGMSPLNYLTTIVDTTVPTPSLSLEIERSFPSDLVGQHARAAGLRLDIGRGLGGNAGSTARHERDHHQ